MADQRRIFRMEADTSLELFGSWLYKWHRQDGSSLAGEFALIQTARDVFEIRLHSGPGSTGWDMAENTQIDIPSSPCSEAAAICVEMTGLTPEPKSRIEVRVECYEFAANGYLERLVAAISRRWPSDLNEFQSKRARGAAFQVYPSNITLYGWGRWRGTVEALKQSFVADLKLFSVYPKERETFEPVHQWYSYCPGYVELEARDAAGFYRVELSYSNWKHPGVALDCCRKLWPLLLDDGLESGETPGSQQVPARERRGQEQYNVVDKGAKTKARPGKPRYPENAWAREQVNEKGRDKREVYKEWCKRKGSKAISMLADPWDSFTKAIKP